MEVSIWTGIFWKSYDLVARLRAQRLSDQAQAERPHHQIPALFQKSDINDCQHSLASLRKRCEVQELKPTHGTDRHTRLSLKCARQRMSRKSKHHGPCLTGSSSMFSLLEHSEILTVDTDIERMTPKRVTLTATSAVEPTSLQRGGNTTETEPTWNAHLRR